MTNVVVFNGTAEETVDLLAALDRNCACVKDESGARTTTCVVHTSMLREQRWMDGLVFARRMRARLNLEERSR